MKTYIDEEVGRVFVFTLAEVKELLDRIRKGIRGDERQKRMCLAEMIVRWTKYLEKAEE